MCRTVMVQRRSCVARRRVRAANKVVRVIARSLVNRLHASRSDIRLGPSETVQCWEEFRCRPKNRSGN